MDESQREIKQRYINKLHNDVRELINKDIIDLFKNIMLPKSYPALPKDEKEKEVFNTTRLLLDTSNKGHEAMKYLIFEYKISEEYHTQYTMTKNLDIDEMFAKRKKDQIISFTEELNKELDPNLKETKKIKL